MSKESGCDSVSRCANCGVKEGDGDGVKLKQCSACHLVRYCSVKCQKEHRPKHKRECKRRMAEMRDEILFKQPEGTHCGDCQICCLPMSISFGAKSIGANPVSTACCCNFLCKGCQVAMLIRETPGRRMTCPFCRGPIPNSMAEAELYEKGRIAVDDPHAIYRAGTIASDRGDYRAAFEHYSRAAELGEVEAHFQLGNLYSRGEGVEKDKTKAGFHYEKAALAGHPVARCILGKNEVIKDLMLEIHPERGIKHLMIAAKQGDNNALGSLKDLYKNNFLRKDELVTSLRGHQAAADAMKSPQREMAASRSREGV